MFLRSVVLILLFDFSHVPPALAQDSGAAGTVSQTRHLDDYSNVVVPIADVGLSGFNVAETFGTGFCLDEACRFIVTNYHVAKLAQPRKIAGTAVVGRYLATGPDDQGATVNEGLAIGALKYAMRRDLAILELRRPLVHHHGVGFNLEPLEKGQAVDIYAYPKDAASPFRRLRHARCTFRGETTSGLLAFLCDSGDGTLRPGASGGIVVDSGTQEIVGVLNGVTAEGGGLAIAVPVGALANFVGQLQPQLARALFRPADEISSLSPDFYPKLASARSPSLQPRPQETNDVQLLRGKAQSLSDQLRNAIAVQTFAWGRGNRPPAAEAQYEVQVIDGYQHFRSYPDGKKEFKDIPFPPINTVMVPGGEWSELPAMVGAQLRLRIIQAPDQATNGRIMKVFQYQADAEDKLCIWKTIDDYIVRQRGRVQTVSCYGEVWTDENLNILRISEHYELEGNWKRYDAVVTYARLREADESSPVIPVSIATQAEYKNKLYWCRGEFKNYRIFDSWTQVARE